MGKFTGKKRKLNYKPIFWVAAVALPVLIGVGILAWPRQPITIVFDQLPQADGRLTSHGTFHLTWQTNVETRGTVFYRYSPEQRFQHMLTNPSRRHQVAIPAKDGQRVELHVEAADPHGKTISPTITVTAKPAP